MQKKESTKLTWSDVKPAVISLEKKQLLQLIGDLYNFSKDNQAFFHARFGVGTDPLKPYMDIIHDCMYPDVLRSKPLRISKAKSTISDYAKATGDAIGEAELMTFFMECGNNFTLEFGDINEEFYDALNSMYRRAVRQVVRLPTEQRQRLQVRLKQVMTSSSGIGWGYHDALRDDYFSTFKEKA